jgi:hypothetical protein
VAPIMSDLDAIAETTNEELRSTKNAKGSKKLISKEVNVSYY